MVLFLLLLGVPVQKHRIPPVIIVVLLRSSWLGMIVVVIVMLVGLSATAVEWQKTSWFPFFVVVRSHQESSSPSLSLSPVVFVKKK